MVLISWAFRLISLFSPNLAHRIQVVSLLCHSSTLLHFIPRIIILMDASCSPRQADTLAGMPQSPSTPSHLLVSFLVLPQLKVAGLYVRDGLLTAGLVYLLCQL